MGFFSFETAWRTLQGYEAINMLRKGQMYDVEKGDSLKPMAFIASLFGVAVEAEQENEISRPPAFLSDFLQHNLTERFALSFVLSHSTNLDCLQTCKR
ncbi:MAG: hypothetical protein ACJ8AG_19235 [Ktedonobacteraceae bacterium]|jgi:hypothetical protein